MKHLLEVLHSSERMRARESASMLELASRLGHLGAWAVDVPEMTITWSAEALAIHEFKEGECPTLEGVRNQIHPDWMPGFDAAFGACLRDGVPFDIEFQTYTERRKLIWVRLIGEASRDAEGRVHRVHGAVQDISERKMQAERYQALSERLTTTLESVTDGFYMLDREWRFTYVNREAERILQRRRADLLGRVVWEQFPAALGSTLHHEYERALADDVAVEFEMFYPPLQIWVRVTAYPSVQGLAVYFRDVTESKNAREALARSEERYRLLFESSADAIFSESPEREILSANSAACAMFRMTEEELCQAGPARLIAADDPRLPALAAKRRFSGNNAKGELTLVRGDGSRFEAELTSAQYRNSAGDLFTIVTVRDITERMQHREEILRLNADLAQRVRDRTAELEAANDQLKDFAHSLAHDLRSPIAAINVFSESLEGALAASASERELHYVRRVRAAGKRMDDFVTALLALASLSQADMHMGEVNLSEIASAILADLQDQARSRRVIAKVQDGLLAWGDARLLGMALENLLGNAWKFTGRREISEISFSARRAPDGELVYCVEDNGAGFDMAYADKLFRTFQRLHSDSEFPGVGIGLTNVHRIIGRHAGRIWAESVEGRGARFFFTLGGPPERQPG
jgi:PAS domain S-box-containing protein